MSKNDIYFKKIEHNNMIYSIDMLRLKTYITYAEFSELEFVLNSAYKDRIKKFWVSDRIMQFHYNYVIEFEEFSYYFGFMHNSEGVNYNKENLKYNFTIEFNPNKVRYNKFLQYILNKFGDWFLRSFDLAIDIPVNILDIIVDAYGKRKVHTVSYGVDNVTYTVGTGNGRFKVYNKKNESDLSIVGDLTRVEVSCQYDDFPIAKTRIFQFDEGLLPHVYFNQYIFSFLEEKTKDKTLLAILYAVQHGYPIKDLSRVYKQKIANLLQGGSLIKFNRKTATNILQQVIYSYFVTREGKQVIL